MGKETEWSEEEVEVCLAAQERKIIEVIRGMDFGEVRIIITDGKPTRMEEIQKNIKL